MLRSPRERQDIVTVGPNLTPPALPWAGNPPLTRRAAGVCGMPKRDAQAVGPPAVEQILGYLNFSSGAADVQFLGNLNQLFAWVAIQKSGTPIWFEAGRLLTDRLAALRTSSPTFRDAEQAASVLELVFDQTLPAYRRFHRDLLFHRNDKTIFRPFFVGRVCETVLKQGPPWSERDRIVGGAV